MSAIASIDDLVSRMSGGSSGTPDNLFFLKTPRVAGAAATAPSAGSEVSMWLYEGYPGSGATPSSIIYPTNVTRGGMKQADPSGGRQKWLTAASFTGIDSGTLILYDRLMQQGGLSSSVTTNQSISSTITRYTNGLGNIAWIEISTAASSPSPVTFHFDYTDENGSAATTPEMQIGASNFNRQGQMIRSSLATVAGVGGRGIKNLTNFKQSGSSGTAGDYCAVIAHPLAVVPSNVAGACGLRNWLLGTMVTEILTDACLGLFWICNSTTIPEGVGSLHMVEA